ncbi:protein kinase [Blastopirellula sp. JC732]|uniref:non-specific serine/threonine protein kinase n=1 Tax=Blastopirellula sediminis TaxID=2894196 RepID=A0A9X1MSA2_9BACT|nr:serine/threonine-protein kinase [Blastopirellula sediminis]MCC9605568.1 protein kinase [Blastopirellula sediminis]MCC9631132.1 protein kinase [Blastopirellula sediminis]
MNEQSIFCQALELTDPDQRAEYLDEACGDDVALRRQVESLLEADERSGDFLKVPAMRQFAPAADDSIDCSSPTRCEPGDSPAEINLSFLQPSASPNSLGLLGHYEALQVLGRGGCGIVLKAFDNKLHRVVAIKVIAPELATTSPARKRFLREARAAASLHHENIVSIYSVEDEPIPFLVMEYLDGGTLQDRVDETGPLDVAETLQIGRQIAEGLAVAHSTGLVHRDIKPCNILLDSSSQRIKISDFGLARTADDASITQSGVIAGTPLYMSPEQARGEAVDPRSDLFSLGGVLYLMCSGRPPFRAATTIAVLKRVIEDEPRTIAEIIPDVPAPLTELIAMLHAKDPSDRYQTAAEVAKQLADFERRYAQDGHLLQSRNENKVTLAETGRRDRRTSNRWPLAAAVAIFLVAVIGVGWSEASGTTSLSQTVVRLFTKTGTLVVEIDDPGVAVRIDGKDLVISTPGVQEIRLRPGKYQLQATKDGRPVGQELITITQNGRQTVRVTQEGPLSVPPAQHLLEPMPAFDAGAPVSRKPHFAGEAGGIGDWVMEGDELVQKKPGKAVMLFGSPNWTDYDVTVEARSLYAGPKSEGSALFFRALSDRDNCVLITGSYGGTIMDVTKRVRGEWIRIGMPYGIEHEFRRWYTQKVEVRGDHIRCFVDGKMMFDRHDDSHPRGMIGLGSHNTVTRWRNLKVTAPDGTVLWEGFPDVPTGEYKSQATWNDFQLGSYALSWKGSTIRTLDKTYHHGETPDNPNMQLCEVSIDAPQELLPTDLEPFAVARNLRKLEFRFPEITDATIPFLSQLKQLTELNLEGSGISQAGYEQLKTALPDCKIQWKLLEAKE